MPTIPKKKIQVAVDAKVADKVNSYLDALGLTPTVLINMLYRKIEATGEIPFSPALTEAQKAELDLAGAIQTLPVKQYDSVDDFLDEAEDEYGEY